MSALNTRSTRFAAPVDGVEDGAGGPSAARAVVTGTKKARLERRAFELSASETRYDLSTPALLWGSLCERRPDSGWESTRDSETLHSVVGKQP